MTIILKINQDNDAVKPRTYYDHFGQLFIPPSRHACGDCNAGNPDYLDSDDKFIILPVVHYTHGNTVLNTTGFSCPWDSGQCGWTYVSKATFLREYGRDTVFTRYRAEELLRAEIETYSKYMSGDVWGFTVENSDGDIVDSCWGFYGNDPETNGMFDHLEYPGQYEVIYE